MKYIVITSPDYVDDEGAKINLLFEAGVDRVHIRKPDSSLREVKMLIDDIDYQYRSRLILHGHFALLDEISLGGVHLNSRNPQAPGSVRHVSRSCHSLDEVEQFAGLDYVTLSPIFDSISKIGYVSKFDIGTIRRQIVNRRVVALGGVTPEHFHLLREAGFYGAALLGAIWSGDFYNNLKSLRRAIELNSDSQ